MESSISKKETVILQEEVTSKKDGFEFSDDDLQSENSRGAQLVKMALEKTDNDIDNNIEVRGEHN